MGGGDFGFFGDFGALGVLGRLETLGLGGFGDLGAAGGAARFAGAALFREALSFNFFTAPRGGRWGLGVAGTRGVSVSGGIGVFLAGLRLGEETFFP